MNLDDHEPEIRFATKIDCRFPYGDRAVASALIPEGWSISLNAAFDVLHEICRKPRHERVKRERQHDLVDEWAVRFEHSLREPMLRCARGLIEKQYLPWQEAVSVMKQIEHFKGQYAALNIALFSGDCDSDVGNATLEATHERIRKEWSQKRSETGGSPQSST